MAVNELGWLNYVGDVLPRLLPIDSWQSFCIHWGRLSSEAAAIGLLHAGPNVLRLECQIRNNDQAREVVAQAVNFYLRYAAEGEKYPHLARVAKQVLIGKIVRARFVTVEDPKLFPVHLELLNFLQKPDPDLLKTPNPQAVLNHLIGLSWQWAGKQNWNPEMHQLLQPHGKLIVRAMISWGWADYVEDEYQKDLVIQELRAFIGEKRPDWETPNGHRHLMHWMCYGRPDTDSFRLDEPNTENIVVSRAYDALFRIAWKKAWSA